LKVLVIYLGEDFKFLSIVKREQKSRKFRQVPDLSFLQMA